MSSHYVFGRGRREYNLRVGERCFSTGTHVMGIINVTPDSFYPLSRVTSDAAERACVMLEQGAEIIDIGGQSTRPGAACVGVLEEMARVTPAVRAIKKLGALVSVDTFYPEVALAALDEGADMINDVSCLAYDGMADIVAESGAAICVMHDRRKTACPDLMTDKISGLTAAVDKLLAAGVDKSKILLDGGIGFNKNNAEDWELLKSYSDLMAALEEYPFLLGTSRKSMFGGEVGERLSATLETTAQAVRDGVLFVRVHDVSENRLVIENESGTKLR